jgi:hypothetical protein
MTERYLKGTRTKLIPRSRTMHHKVILENVLYAQGPVRHLFSSSLLVAMEDVALLAWQQ